MIKNKFAYKITIILAITIIFMAIAFQISGDGVKKACATKDRIEKALVGYILQIEKVHHTDHGEFLKSIVDMEKYYPESLSDLNYLSSQTPSNNWDVALYLKNDNVVVFAVAKSPRYKNYSLHSSVGILKFDSSQKRYATKYCRSDQPGSITLNQSAVQQSHGFSCPIGTHEDC
jgi:hypothetical protein